MKGTLTAQQLQALYGFAGSRGRNWKSALRLAWETGNYLGFEQSSDLQQIRSTFGPSWLISFRFPNETPIEPAPLPAVTGRSLRPLRASAHDGLQVLQQDTRRGTGSD